MSITNKIASNFIWRFLERSGAQIVTFIVSIILARLLNPDVYGSIALVTVFITILQVFVDSGLANSLIQKKNVDDLDYSSVFYFNIFVCLVLYGVMFLAAPLISKFYEISELTPIIRVLSITLVISGVKNIQQAYVSKNMLFKRFFWSTISGTIFSAIVGIVMAYCGFGIWALVYQHLVNLLVGTIVLWITVKWRPKLMFSWVRLKRLLSFGWKLLVSSLIDNIYNNIRQLLIGKMYSSSDLGYYNQGKKFPDVIVSNIGTSIDSVLFPTMSEAQDNISEVRLLTRRSIKMSSYLMAPMMVGLACVSKPLTILILTEKWLPCVLYMQIFCIVYLFHPIQSANLNAIKALGRSDVFLMLDIIKRVVSFVVLFTAIWFGVEVIAYSMLINTLLTLALNSWPNKKLLGYTYKQQIFDIIPPILLACVMGVIVYAISFFDLPVIVMILLQVTVGIFVYLFGSTVFRFESFIDIVNVIKRFFLSKTKNRNL